MTVVFVRLAPLSFLFFYYIWILSNDFDVGIENVHLFKIYILQKQLPWRFGGWTVFLGTISSVESRSTHKCCIFKNYFSILSLHTLAEVREKNPFCSFGWKFFGLQAFVCVCSCASFVGCRGGDQPLYISKSCSVGNLGHEIIHTLGLHHEHTRKDRDQYITVQWQNIMPGKHLSWL